MREGYRSTKNARVRGGNALSRRDEFTFCWTAFSWRVRGKALSSMHAGERVSQHPLRSTKPLAAAAAPPVPDFPAATCIAATTELVNRGLNVESFATSLAAPWRNVHRGHRSQSVCFLNRQSPETHEFKLNVTYSARLDPKRFEDVLILFFIVIESLTGHLQYERLLGLATAGTSPHRMGTARRDPKGADLGRGGLC